MLPAATRTPTQPSPRRCRIALYSHDTMGLGHMRRNLLMAQTLSRRPVQAEILLVCGTQMASTLWLPPGSDCLTLPSLYKDHLGRYRARNLTISLDDLIDLRSRIILAGLQSFDPDVLIVDNVPRGAACELDTALEVLSRNGRTRCVLGLRDVLDDPAVTCQQWHRAANDQAIRAYYDTVWVYGDPAVYDLVQQYNLSIDVAAKTRFVGYLDQSARLRGAPTGESGLPADPWRLPDPVVVCVVGGGQDGVRLAQAFVDAQLPPHTSGLLVTGPFMPPEATARLHRRAADRPRLQLIDYAIEAASLIRRADRVIAMGGYNTIGEILAFEKPALIVPRVHPRREQFIRAQRLCEMGLLDMLHPEALTPHALTRWMAAEATPVRRARDQIDLNGLVRIPKLIQDLLADRIRRTAHAIPEKKLQHAAP